MDKLLIFKDKVIYWQEEFDKASTDERRKHCARQLARAERKVANPDDYSGY